jgi:hypothetical protein
VKVALVALSAMLFSPSLNANTQAGISPWEHPEVLKVDCDEGSGSAFRIAPNLAISVAHVTSLEGCKIDGLRFQILQTKGDFTILETFDEGPWLKIDCKGFVKDREYEALGYAMGLDTQTEVDLKATGDMFDGFARLWNVFTVIPGQSGGPMVDKLTGEAVGTVNIFNPESGDSGSVPLSETPVCKGRTA